MLTFLALHETGRALLEPLRVPRVTHLEIVSAVLGCATIIALLVRRVGTVVPTAVSLRRDDAA